MQVLNLLFYTAFTLLVLVSIGVIYLTVMDRYGRYSQKQSEENKF